MGRWHRCVRRYVTLEDGGGPVRVVGLDEEADAHCADGALLQPLAFGLIPNLVFGLLIAAVVVAFEARLRETEVTRIPA